MSIDLSAFPPAVKAKQIHLGLQFGSQDTLAQANQTLDSYKKHGAVLAKAGFTAADAQRLADARDLLSELGVGREAARGQKKVNGKVYVDAMNQGQGVRLEARVIAESVKEDLEESGDPTAPDALRVVTTVLQQTQVAGPDAERLASQLDQLRAAFEQPAVAPAAAPRGGADIVTSLQQSADALRKADQEGAGVRGTPAETQQLDQIDGIIVRLVRRARKAAVAVSRATGDAALARAFKLDKLYRSRAAAGEAEDEVEEGEEI